MTSAIYQNRKFEPCCEAFAGSNADIGCLRKPGITFQIQNDNSARFDIHLHNPPVVQFARARLAEYWNRVCTHLQTATVSNLAHPETLRGGFQGVSVAIGRFDNFVIVVALRIGTRHIIRAEVTVSNDRINSRPFTKRPHQLQFNARAARDRLLTISHRSSGEVADVASRMAE
jgi:hypothetical protein